jgi:hypothetical protein
VAFVDDEKVVDRDLIDLPGRPPPADGHATMMDHAGFGAKPHFITVLTDAVAVVVVIRAAKGFLREGTDLFPNGSRDQVARPRNPRYVSRLVLSEVRAEEGSTPQ